MLDSPESATLAVTIIPVSPAVGVTAPGEVTGDGERACRSGSGTGGRVGRSGRAGGQSARVSGSRLGGGSGLTKHELQNVIIDSRNTGNRHTEAHAHGHGPTHHVQMQEVPRSSAATALAFKNSSATCTSLSENSPARGGSLHAKMALLASLIEYLPQLPSAPSPAVGAFVPMQQRAQACGAHAGVSQFRPNVTHVARSRRHMAVGGTVLFDGLAATARHLPERQQSWRLLAPFGGI
jgi:hypothetical protein